LSYWYDIIANVKADLDSALTTLSVPTVIKRRNTYVGTDPLPVVIISPGDKEVVKSTDFNLGTTVIYPVTVNLIYPDDRINDLAADAQAYLDIRQAIRQRLYYPLLINVNTVYDVNGEATKPFTLYDQKSTYSTTQWTCTYQNLEQRRAYSP
jgi:hypothetical protein